MSCPLDLSLASRTMSVQVHNLQSPHEILLGCQIAARPSREEEGGAAERRTGTCKMSYPAMNVSRGVLAVSTACFTP